MMYSCSPSARGTRAAKVKKRAKTLRVDIHCHYLNAEVGKTIARLKSEGQSIVLVEQNVKLAFSLADDVVILNTGRVAFAGPCEAVRDNEALITQHLGVF